MFEKKPNKRPFYARIEYRTVKSLVEQKLAEGYSKQLIYEELKGDGRVTMSYTSFCDYIRGNGDLQHGKKSTPSNQKMNQASSKTVSAPAPVRKIGPADKNEPFRIEKKTLEELV